MNKNLQSWLVSSSERIYPATLKPSAPRPLALEVAKNERFSFQMAIRNESPEAVEINLSASSDTFPRLRIRRVGYVAIPHRNTQLTPGTDDNEGAEFLPGFVPDPLYDDTSLLLPAGETHSFWLTASPEPLFTEGTHIIELLMQGANGAAQPQSLSVKVHPLVLETPLFSMTHWIYLDALMDWYSTKGFDEAFWKILPAYLRNMVNHGIDTLFVPLFTPPLDGVKRPTQLVDVQNGDDGNYHFGWEKVRRYIRCGRAAGFTAFEWSHLFTQWGAKNALRIYRSHGESEELLWPAETVGDDPVYRDFLGQFLPAFQNFLLSEDLLSSSIFHLSDEPHGDEALARYKRAKEIVRDIAPWLSPIVDAVSGYREDLGDLMDIPIPAVHKVEEFLHRKAELWCYYSCLPRDGYINRFVDTPLAKIAMHGVLFYRWPIRGFLHWGYNYWYKRATRALVDPYSTLDAGAWPYWAYGDPFVVYPGQDGPIDSIRWEVFSESLQDYALLQTLKIDRDSCCLQDVKSFTDFPKAAEWRAGLRHGLFSQFVNTI